MMSEISAQETAAEIVDINVDRRKFLFIQKISLRQTNYNTFGFR